MSEFSEAEVSMKERRGTTLIVLAILSWVSMGFSFLSTVPGVFTGPMSADELADTKVEILAAFTPEMIEILGTDFVEENIRIIEKTNEYHYIILGVNLSTLILGFFGVLQMFNLRKKGYFFYLVYTVVPVFLPLILFGNGFLVMAGLVASLLIGGVFCLLYGLQLKRMS